MPAAADDTVASIAGGCGPPFPHLLFGCDHFEGARFKAMKLRPGVLQRGLSAGFVLQLGIVLISAAWPGAGMSQKLVDPNVVAPEYRAAAEKRRAEQIRLYECSKKADIAKVVRRDRVAFINECLDK
jgi:hypothetical protein